MANKDVVLVSAPNQTGENFIKLLQSRGIPYAAIVNNAAESERMVKLGVEQIIMVNTAKADTWIVPEVDVGKIFLFEKSQNLCCRYIQICHSWTSKPIYVITESDNPRLVYKGLGASYVIHNDGKDCAFLLTDDLIPNKK